MKKLLLALALIAGTASAGTLNWTWTNPTQYEDGSALPATDITQTRIEYGSCNGSAFGTKVGEVVNSGNGTKASKTSIVPGTYCSRAYTTAKGKESLASNVTSVTIDQPNPNPPTLTTTADVAVIPVFNKSLNAWLMGDQVGTIKLGMACNPDVSYGNGFYAPANAKDVSYYHGRRARKVIAVYCGA